MFKMALAFAVVFVLVGVLIVSIYHSDKKTLLQWIGIVGTLSILTIAVLGFIVIVF